MDNCHFVNVCRCEQVDCFVIPEYSGDEFICEFKFIEEAMKEAKHGEIMGGIPIGSVLVSSDWKVIGRGYNKKGQNPTMHGAIGCIHNAIKRLKRLGDVNYMNFKGSILYSTHMPCDTCAHYVIQFGISEVVAGESETFDHTKEKEVIEKAGIKVVDLDMEVCKQIHRDFVYRNCL